jgi:hypothetical protein
MGTEVVTVVHGVLYRFHSGQIRILFSPSRRLSRASGFALHNMHVLGLRSQWLLQCSPIIRKSAFVRHVVTAATSSTETKAAEETQDIIALDRLLKAVSK